MGKPPVALRPRVAYEAGEIASAAFTLIAFAFAAAFGALVGGSKAHHQYLPIYQHGAAQPRDRNHAALDQPVNMRTRDAQAGSGFGDSDQGFCLVHTGFSLQGVWVHFAQGAATCTRATRVMKCDVCRRRRCCPTFNISSVLLVQKVSGFKFRVSSLTANDFNAETQRTLRSRRK